MNLHIPSTRVAWPVADRVGLSREQKTPPFKHYAAGGVYI